MKAVAHVRYGRPHLLELRDVEVPQPADDEVLLRARASSVNPADWYGVTGMYPARIGNGLRRPKNPAVGIDVAGIVEAVGPRAEGLDAGDEVFGRSGYAWAEYATAPRAQLARPFGPADLRALGTPRGWTDELSGSAARALRIWWRIRGRR